MNKEATVTARMTREKKVAVGRILDQWGLSASGVINQLYDYILENKELPFAANQQEKGTYTMEELLDTMQLIDSISLPDDNRFATMSDSEITAARLSRQ